MGFKAKRHYSAKDSMIIMMDNYSELWDRAKLIVEKLLKVQNKVVGMLPTCKENLPKSFEELAEQKAQRNLSDYIRLRLLYDFAGKCERVIDDQCRDMARKHIDGDENGIIDSEVVLRQMMDAIDQFPFEDIANGVKDLLCFYELYKQGLFGQRMSVTAFGCWTFSDIIGMIQMYGLHGIECKELWRDAIDDIIPTCPNIGELLSDNDIL